MSTTSTRRKKPRNKAQAERFIKAAREAGASEDEREFDKNLRRIARTEPKREPEKSKE
jgi:hypothetical protein